MKNPPRKHDKKLEKIEPWIWRLKNDTDFHLQDPSQNWETRSEMAVPWSQEEQNAKPGAHNENQLKRVRQAD
jgi:hypothetical protein